MLDKDSLGFTRLHSVKNLYIPQGFLNNFDVIEFQDVMTFVKCLKNDYCYLKGEIHIHVYNKEEFMAVKKLLTKSGLSELCRLYLIIHDEDVLLNFRGLGDKRFGLIVPHDFNYIKFKDILQEWYQNSPLYYRFYISWNNIDIVIEDLISVFTQGRGRLFDLKFDYFSFESATMADIHRILFRISRLTLWETNELKQNERMEFKAFGFQKPIFVDRDFNLYYTHQHWVEGKVAPLFTLQTGNGEDIPLRELNRIRQYVDLTTETIFPTIGGRTNYVDFYHNVLIQGVVNEIPLITQQIIRWLK